jgi:beta-lactamase regulating signal transducer with metallopeptidase domain
MISAVTNHLWQSTVFALVAAILTLALRKNGAHTRYWLWFAASMKFLVPFSVLAAACVSLGQHAAPAITTPTVSAVAHQVVQPFSFDASAPSTPTTPSVSAARSYPQPVSILAMVWACGSISVLAFWFVRWLRVKDALKSAKPTAMAIAAPIPVKTAPSHLEPGIVGIVRPVLLLPDGIREHLTQAEFDAIVAHEICHLRRCDNLTAALHMLVEALFWFFPVVWWLGGRLVDERERACDEAVVETGNDPKVYAEGILKVCKFFVSSSVPCVAGVTGAGLKERIERILSQQILQNLTLAKKTLVAAAFILVAAGAYEGSRGLANAASVPPSDRVMVFRDAPSWDRHPDFEDVLANLGMPFDSKPSSDMAATNLPRYNFVIIPGAQRDSAYYKAFADNAAAFERYVSSGGTLVVEMNGAEPFGIALPGGLSMVRHAAFDNLITVPDHPILTPLRGKQRISANLASHGYLIGVPAGSIVLAAEMAPGTLTADMGKPTFVEYDYGKGHIIAAAQCFHDQDGSGRGPLMITLLKYAAARAWFAPDAAPPAAVAAAPPELPNVDPNYAGHYEFGNRVLTISSSGNRLFMQLTEAPLVEIYAKSKRDYFAKTVDAQITFVTDNAGLALSLVHHQNGRDTTAPRIDDMLAKTIEDSLRKRITDKVPAPGSEATLRRHIDEMVSGKPNYDLMTPDTGEVVRLNLVRIQKRLIELGRLETVEFKNVGRDGSDAYQVTFEHGSVPWRIRLNADGKLASEGAGLGKSGQD